MQETRASRSLRTLSGAAERDEELSGCMEVADSAREIVAGRHVLLVDDVVTYGTHFREAKRTLLDASAGEVSAIALAAAHGYPSPL